MPEGDVLHRAAAQLQPLVGDLIEAESPHPRGRATGVARVLDGRVLQGIEAVGKHLLLRFEGRVTLRSHLRMSGRWRLEPRGTVRRGSPWLVLRGREWEATQWNGPVLTLDDRPLRSLGPDLLGEQVEVTDLVARLRRSDQSRAVGEALVDQRLVSGVGNMWLAESLWHTRLSPWSGLGMVCDGDLAATLDWARTHMRAAVAGKRPRRAVYRRAGRACHRCAKPIESRGLGDANRVAYWCPLCQKAGNGT